MALQYLQLFHEVVREVADLSDELHGVDADGWTGGRLLVTHAAGEEGRKLEVVLGAPARHPARRVKVTLRASGDATETTYLIVPGGSISIKVPLPPEAGFVELLFDPLFQPSALNGSDDTRWLGLLCFACHITGPTARVELLTESRVPA
jgi:hypothetical protein